MKRCDHRKLSTAFLGLLLIAARPLRAGLIVVKAKPATVVSKEKPVQESEGYRFAEAYIDVLAYWHNYDDYMDKLDQNNKNRGTASWPMEMLIFKQSNGELDEAEGVLKPFLKKSARDDIRKRAAVLIMAFGGIIQNQDKMVRQIKDVLNETPGIRVGNFWDRMTSLRLRDQKIEVALMEGVGAIVYAMLEYPKDKKDVYGGWDFTKAQKATLLLRLESYFGPEVKEVKAGMLPADGAAAGLYKCLTASGLCQHIKTTDEL